MENPDDGPSPPAGASVEPDAQQPHRDPAGRPVQARGAQPAEPVPAASGAPVQDRTTRKRRRRKRGHRVFVREKPVAPARDMAASALDILPNGTPFALPGKPSAPPQRLLSRNPSALPLKHSSPGGEPFRSMAGVASGPPYRRAPRPGDLPAYAALDLGTNNCRLLVAVPSRPGQFRVIDAFSRIVRLGEGLSITGRLSDDAMARALEALAICADKLAAREIRRARLIATEACRAAGNGAEFLARVARTTGLELEVIDRKTEAGLAVSGCGPLIERDTSAVVLFDIGGGSSEIALVDLSRERSPRLARHIVAWTSLPVGVVSLAERFGGRHVTREIFAAMVEEVERLIARFDGRGNLGALAAGPGFHLLGTSGTVTTLAGVHLGLARYDRRKVDGLWMDGAQIDAMIERLVGWDFDERVANPCIGTDRADLVLAGCAILEAIRRTWPSDRLRVADRGLREGILSDLMARDGAWHRRRRNGGGGRP